MNKSQHVGTLKHDKVFFLYTRGHTYSMSAILSADNT